MRPQLPSFCLPLLALFFLGHALPGQILSGTIEYEVSQSTILPAQDDGEESTLSSDVRKVIEDLELSGAFAKRYALTFAPGAYEFREIQGNNETVSRVGMTVTVINHSAPPQHFYTNTDTRRYVNSEAVADQLFRYEGVADSIEWTLTGETLPASAATLGFRLQTASAITPDGDSLLAAYAPALPVPIGPRNFYGTPGAILQLEVSGAGKVMRYRATSLTPLPEPPVLSPPGAGKATTPQRFRAAREKYRERKESSGVQIFGRGPG